MIAEGVITTTNSDGSLHLAPMGPIVVGDFQRLILRPYETSTTCRNLVAQRCGVFHITDDVLLLARAVVGHTLSPAVRPSQHINGHLLTDACRAYEFRISEIDDREPRRHMIADVISVERFRDFFGFNRAKHAVIEAAILCTRLHLLPHDRIAEDFERLAVWVEKTAGDAEREAFELLLRHFNTIRLREVVEV